MSFQTAAVIIIVSICAMLALWRMMRFFRRGRTDNPCRGCTQCEKEMRRDVRPGSETEAAPHKANGTGGSPCE